jgi:cytochrome bd-type quinol oxidase subunit 2
MTLLSDPLTYLFYPNPGNAAFTSPKALALLIVCAVMLVASFAIRRWRNKLQNSVTRKLSKSWSSASFWFGLIGLFLVFARIEEIGYISMRFWWVIWIVALALYCLLQVRIYRARHYEVLPMQRSEDPRSKYLPGKKRR